MKKLFLVFLILGVTKLQAQNNEIKGRLGVLPFPFMFCIGAGLGYERMIKPNLSAQLMFNYMVFDISNTDASGSFYISNVVPEVRYYFKEKSGDNKPFYLGLFNEIGKRIIDQGEGASDQKASEFCPGLLFGRYGRFNKGRGIYEAFIGVKYRFATTKTSWRDSKTNTEFFTTDKSATIGIRAGINIILRF